MAIQIGKEILPKIAPLIELLDTHELITQQQIIEILVWRHCQRMQGDEDFVLSSMVKHIKQFEWVKHKEGEALTGGGKTMMGGDG